MKTGDLAKLIGGELRGDPEAEVCDISAPEGATRSSLVFYQAEPESIATSAGCVILPSGSEVASNATLILVKDPKLAFAKAAQALIKTTDGRRGAHPLANVEESASISDEAFIAAHSSVGARTEIGARSVVLEGSRIGQDVRIGSGCVIHPNVVVGDRTVIGDGALIHSGVVIGADGFGFVRDGESGYVKFPQIGRVLIGEDVEIGANTCIDRGALGDTVIGDGTKIDNLVQIAHNVKIGKRVIIAGQSGVAGSAVIGDDCVIAGQVGISENVKLEAGVSIGGQSMVMPGKVLRKGVWWGSPVRRLDEQMEQVAELRGIGRLRAKVAELQRIVERLVERKDD